MTEHYSETTSEESSHPMALLLAEDLNLPTIGEIRSGRVVSHRNNEILVDIGAKSEGIITAQEIEEMDREMRQLLAVGNEIQVCIIETEDADGNLILSYTKVAEEYDWKKASELLDSQETCQSKIIGFNRGGLLANMGVLRAFIPKSQLGHEHRLNRNNETQEEQLKNLIGEQITAKVLEVDRKRNRLILSEKAAEAEIRKSRQSDLLATLKVGEIRTGHVVNIAEFGAFVDIGGIEGLVHLSELSWKRINKPSDVLKVGDSVEVVVINIDKDRQRLALSMKRLQPDPWSQIESLYSTDQLAEGTITKLTKFGAFARINDENQLIGLIHISEMTEDHVNHPADVVKPGDTVTVRIIRIDKERRQLGLSMKQALSDQYLDADIEMLSQIEG